MSDQLFRHIAATVPKMEGWAWIEKANHLATMIIENKPKLVVEIGVFGERSLIPMGLALRAVGEGGVAWGIDPWMKEAALEGQTDPVNDEWWGKLNLEHIYQGFIGHVISEQLTREIRWIREKGDRAVKFFDDYSIGLLHSDSNHSELISLQEVDLWHRKIAYNGLWVFDDVHWPTQKKAVDKIGQLGFDKIYETTCKDGSYAVFRRN
jgi:Methyltransferase domain